MNVFLIAGEESGDKLGMALMQGLTEISPHPPKFSGIGGARMQAQGLETLFPMSDISVMGIVEILKQYRFLKSRVTLAAQAVLDQKPDVLITIDAPEFSLRVAKIVKENSDIPVIHYVAPTVWAWRPKRAAKMAAHVDHVMALLPFEPPYMTAAGMSCDFVGHPVVEDTIATDAEVAEFRAKYDLGDAPYILCLPGSRKSEINRLAPIFGETLEQFAKSNPEVKIVLPTIAHVAPLVQDMTQDWANKPIILDPTAGSTPQDKRAAFKGAHVALAASGTVSLELAANDTPMVIAYDMGWLSRQIIGRMLQVDTVTLANLVTKTRVIPEFIGANCRADRISKGLVEVFNNPDAQRPILHDTMAKLGKGGPNPGIRAAQSVVSYLNRA